MVVNATLYGDLASENQGVFMIDIAALMAIHFDPKWGAPAWLAKVPHLPFDPLRDLQTLDDLLRFGVFPEQELRDHSARDWVPLRFHDRFRDLILSETGGTTGSPKRVYFSQAEFQAGFIDPFIQVAWQVGWQENAQWLYAGPSGPHIIGKVVEPICRLLGSPVPLQIDFDPRWVRRLVDGSMAKQRYLEHLLEQTLQILEHEPVEVIFATPPLLELLGQRLSEERRLKLCGIHYGGMALTEAQVHRFREVYFPQAIHLSGYGNSLVGVAFEPSASIEEALCYFPSADRHQIRIIPLSDAPLGDRLPHLVDLGEIGQVVISRLDPTCFIPNLVERDQAERIRLTKSAEALGWSNQGLRNPQPLVSQGGITGFY
jgi:hypothetical protein